MRTQKNASKKMKKHATKYLLKERSVDVLIFNWDNLKVKIITRDKKGIIHNDKIIPIRKQSLVSV